MGWIGLAIVACLALVVPLVVVVAASTAPVSTTAAVGQKAPGAAAEPRAGKKDDGPKGNNGRGPKGDNGRQKADNAEKPDKAEQGPKGNNGQPGKSPVSITAIDGSNVSLETEDGWSRTIAISDTTVITKGGVTVKAADLKVGDVIRLHQVENADGTFTVDAIRVQPPRTTG